MCQMRDLYLVKLFMKLTLIMAQMITYYQVPSLEVVADIFICLRSISQAFRHLGKLITER